MGQTQYVPWEVLPRVLLGWHTKPEVRDNDQASLQGGAALCTCGVGLQDVPVLVIRLIVNLSRRSTVCVGGDSGSAAGVPGQLRWPATISCNKLDCTHCMIAFCTLANSTRIGAAPQQGFNGKGNTREHHACSPVGCFWFLSLCPVQQHCFQQQQSLSPGRNEN